MEVQLELLILEFWTAARLWPERSGWTAWNGLNRLCLMSIRESQIPRGKKKN